MIIVTAPIDLIQVGQALFPLAWRALSLGADPYVYSDTHAAYPIKPEHGSMLDHSTIAGLVGAGGDIENLPLFVEIDLEENVPSQFTNETITWADFAASINHIPAEINGAFYIEATNGQAYLKASEVIACGLTWLTVAEYQAL